MEPEASATPAPSTAAPARPARSRGRARFALWLAVGALVALSLGLYGRAHDPTGRSLVTLFFTNTLTLKVWLATAAVSLAAFQGLTGLRMYGKLGRQRGPRWVPTAHRLSGTVAFLLTIPVAYHCLWALGFQFQAGTRILVHGVFGCFFFGGLATKVLVVNSRRMPKWALPVMGGSLFTALVVIWATSALWFFRTQGIQF
ncbi:MAG: DUF6529 family protein [Actinomycetota bacterium]|nr:DUF6529 family protein [Actinomycetota bacterium]